MRAPVADALWSVALATHGIDPHATRSLTELMGLAVLAHGTVRPPTVPQAVDILLSPPAAGSPPASRAQLIWTFSTLYDRFYRFAPRQIPGDEFQPIVALAERLDVDLPPPGSGKPALQVMKASAAFLNGCNPIPRGSQSCFFPTPEGRDPYTRITAELEVNRPLESLTKAMDPRAWAQCVKEPFQQSYRVLGEKDPNPTAKTTHMALPVYVPTLAGNGKFIDKLQKMDPDPLDLGKAWEGLLYEEFEVESSGFKFRNLLNIGYLHTADLIEMKYEQTMNTTEWAGGSFDHLLVVNCGLTAAKRDPIDPANSSIVTGFKEVAIADMTPNTFGSWNDVGKLLLVLSPGLLSLWHLASNDLGLCCD